MAKVFLNSGILGGKYGIPEDRRMFSIKTENITPVAYNTDYFESIPTSWAIAYTFKQMLLEKNHDIVQEWVCLFLLHYFGVVRYEMLSGERLQAEYDKDFWSAISGTYPSPKHEKLTSLALLKTADEKTVGGYFPEVVFFPSRGRSEWPKSQLLKPYLEGYYFNKLSWKQSKQLLLVDKKTKMDFHLYLRRIALHV
ncbi:MAG: hypothetical protein JNN15_19770, partial [Blastocatellia bacterium]|nr:hypothetical protein [Blastocatellia bacterium]